MKRHLKHDKTVFTPLTRGTFYGFDPGALTGINALYGPFGARTLKAADKRSFCLTATPSHA